MVVVVVPGTVVPVPGTGLLVGLLPFVVVGVVVVGTVVAGTVVVGTVVVGPAVVVVDGTVVVVVAVVVVVDGGVVVVVLVDGLAGHPVEPDPVGSPGSSGPEEGSVSPVSASPDGAGGASTS
ncbi:MAG TPA: hypothetical protein VMB72_02450 [Acidimicrobiales bacterium]|nr:hypothetical protein [Acidimicrobiales bacterium]